MIFKSFFCKTFIQHFSSISEYLLTPKLKTKLLQLLFTGLIPFSLTKWTHKIPLFYLNSCNIDMQTCMKESRDLI